MAPGSCLADSLPGETTEHSQVKTGVQQHGMQSDLSLHSHKITSVPLFRVGSGAGSLRGSAQPLSTSTANTPIVPNGLFLGKIKETTAVNAATSIILPQFTDGLTVNVDTVNPHLEDDPDDGRVPSVDYARMLQSDDTTIMARIQSLSTWLTSFIPLPSASSDAVGGIAIACTLWSCVCFMMNQGGDRYNVRMPPYFDPDDRSISFRAYVTDLMHWILLTDLAPHQQATAIVSRLGGTARDMGRTLTPDELFNGGDVNGEHLDPVTYIRPDLQL